jgi:hypothetical protein
MHYTNITHPHPALHQETTPQPLREVVAGIVANAPAFTDVAQAGATLDCIQANVRASLRFPQDEFNIHPRAVTSLESAKMSQVTDCLGYTMVGSECLTLAEEAIGPHYVFFANGHAATAIVAKDTAAQQRLYFRDFLTPAFNKDVTPAIDQPVTTITRQAHDPEHPRGVMRFDAHIFTTATATMEEIAFRQPWLFIGNQNSMQSRRWGDDTSQRFTLIASLYPAEVGRKVIEDYAHFNYAVTIGDSAAALLRLHNLRGLYPEIDGRAGHHEIKRLVGQLALDGKAEDATNAISDYTASFYRTRDPRLEALGANLVAVVATGINDAGLAAQAVCTYERAANRSQHTWAPKAWLHAAERLRTQFNLTDPTHIT